MKERNCFSSILVMMVIASLSSYDLSAQASIGPFMKTTGATSIPIGHYEFCKINPGECNTHTAGDVRVRLTEHNWKELLKINDEANRQIEPLSDMELFGVEEHWTYSATSGDCEEYVLWKRFQLIKSGWPPASLLITVVRQQNGEGHAVLTVRTDRGDLILDNLQSDVKLWNKTSYTFLKRQSKNHTGIWEGIYDSRL